MSENVIINHGAPTLAGIKTANLFGYPCSSKEEGLSDIREMNRILSPKGIIAIPVLFQKGRILLYIFRPSLLKQDFNSRAVTDFLEAEGYSCTSVYRCVAQLCQRVRSSSAFPHEIGLFLGYPLEDVKGFIRNHAANYKYSGYWKVYGDETKARSSFQAYRKCSEKYTSCYRAGMHLKDLAVAMG